MIGASDRVGQDKSVSAQAKVTPQFCRQAQVSDGPLRVLWIWHAAVVAEYQKPVQLLGMCPDLDMTLLVPRQWPERAGEMVRAESLPHRTYWLIKGRVFFTGFYYIYFFPNLLFSLLRLRPDVIYCYEEAHTFMAALVLGLRKLFLPKSRVFLYAAQNIKKRYPLPFRLFERYCFRRADAILACGKLVAATLRLKGYKGKLIVVPLPTDTAGFAPDERSRFNGRGRLGFSEGDMVIGYAGKLAEEKGLRVLLDAFAALGEERKNLHLVLAGGGAFREELLKAAMERGISDRVHLPGVIHNSDLPAFMNSLDIFVLPSETRSNWREQFGRVAVEAMSCGVPVIGSTSGEIPYVLGGAGLLFREGDANELAERLRLLVADAMLREQVGRRGRERVFDLFSMEKVAAQHYALYRGLGAGGK